MKRLILYVLWFLTPSLVTSQTVVKDPVKQLLEYSSNTDYSSIKDSKSISVVIEVESKGCHYQNAGLNPGNDVTPTISDKKRVKAIVDLITKIINCDQLPFKQDGQIFSNKEKKLPVMPYGYYQEYTLIVPKDADHTFYVGNTQYTAYPSYSVRGPERLVIGGGQRIYYTPTHYDSFVEIKIIQNGNREVEKASESVLTGVN